MQFILTADWHLRNDVPICRSETQEEWLDYQFDIVEQIFKLAKARALPIYHIGDLFHRSQPYFGVIGRLNNLYNSKYKDVGFYKIAGNHDLPYHNFDNVLNSGWYLAPGIDLKTKFNGASHFGQKHNIDKFIFTHQLVFPNEKSRPPMATGKTAEELLDEFTKADFIFTGDYHKDFHFEKNGRHVINPGCIIRQSINEEKYITKIYFINTDSDPVFSIYDLNDSKSLISNHIEQNKKRDDRIEAFIEVVASSKKVSLSYQNNLETKLKQKGISNGVKRVVIEIQEELNGGK